MTQEEYLQILILQGLIHDDHFVSKTIPFLKPEYFTDPFGEVFSVFNEHFITYNRIPSKDVVRIEAPSTTSVLDSLYDDPFTTDIEWLTDNTEVWCRDRAVQNGIFKSLDILQGTDQNLDVGSIPAIMEDALAVSFDTHIGHNLMDDAQSRWLTYNAFEEKLPFNIHYLNMITRGGITKKTLNVIMAPTGVGKTIILCNFAANYAQQGKNVLYVTLEMAEEKIAQRIDANLMGVEMEEVETMPEREFMRRIDALKHKSMGDIIIKEYPSTVASVNHVRALLKELKIKKDFVPDVICIDYLNIMSSSRIRPGGTTGSYGIVKSIAEEVRGLAQETGARIWSATQTNRGGLGSPDLEMEDVSDSVGLIYTADLFLGVSQTEEMSEQGIYKFKQLKNRYGDKSKYTTFSVGVDKGRMTLYDLEDGGHPPVQESYMIEPGEVDDFDGFTF